MKRTTAMLLVSMLSMPGAVLAQSQPQEATPAVDPEKMGVDLSRIRRELSEPTQSASDDPRRLSYTVQVFGTAVRVDLLEGFSPSGAVPYGPPTHQEVLDVLTPKEFRSPVFPLSSLAVLAAQHLWNYNKKKQCEAELEEYRRLVMQGVQVAAPRCAR